jgi:ABC-type multidrug transport system permease subunit
MNGRQALWIAGRDLFHLFRERETWIWSFLMPPLFMFFIGSVARAPARGPETVAVHAAPEAGYLADELVRRLEGQGFRVVRTDSAGMARYRRRLTVPAGFTEDVVAGRQARLEFTRTGGGLGADYDGLRLRKAAYGIVADLKLLELRGRKPSPEALRELALASRSITVEARPAAEPRRPPSGYQQSVPGMMVMFVLLAMLTTGGVSLLEERRHGLLRRLAAAPLTLAEVLVGKWGSRLALGWIQTAWAVAAGTLLFRIDWGGAWWAVGAVLAVYGALCSLLGMWLGNEGNSPGAVIGGGVIASNVLAALGGCWWPAEIMPLWAQKLSLALPTGWAMDALHRLMSFGGAPKDVLPHLAALGTLTLFCAWGLARRFRFQ